MTPQNPRTTYYGTIGKWSAALATLLGLLAGVLGPTTKTGMALASASGLAMAIGQWANGEGNRQSQDGSP